MRKHIQPFALGLAVSALLVTLGNAQQSGSGGGRSAASKITTRPQSTTSTSPSQTTYYMGRVVMDAGMEPPSPVAVLRVCNGFRHRETYTGSDGTFSFMVGDRSNDMLPDASEDTRGFGQYNGQTTSNANPMTLGQSNFQSPISDCELRADLAGYASSAIHLDPSMANSNVGVIILHNRGKKAGGMVSVASLEVPSKARKDYEKGSEDLEKENLAEAEKSLRKAIDQYPKFAEAWLRLGDLELRRKNMEGSMKDYQQARDADPNFSLPYLRMAFLSAVASNWEQTRQLTERLISLDPVSFPLGYYYNAVAEFNLHHTAKAETSALRAESMDKQHAEPRVELLLASIYNSKGAYSSAADHYRAYLKLVPNGPLTDRVKNDLAKTEELAKSQAPPSMPVAK